MDEYPVTQNVSFPEHTIGKVGRISSGIFLVIICLDNLVWDCPSKLNISLVRFVLITKVGKYSIGIYIKSSKTDELIKKLYIQRKTNTFNYYIEDLFLYYYIPKEIYHPEKETFYSREESLKLYLNCSCVYVSADAVEEYQTFTFYTGEGINLSVDRYESTYDYTTEKYIETNELIEENINEYSYGTSGVSKDSDGNVVLENYVVTNSKMKVE